MISDDTHNYDEYNVIYVSKGRDYADYKVMEIAKKDDIVITQDTGLASLLLLKGTKVINHFGVEFTEKNINNLLESRAMNLKLRKAKVKMVNQKKRTPLDDEEFSLGFIKILNS